MVTWLDAEHRREREAAYRRWLRPENLRGANLRYSVLTLLAGAGRPCSIGELISSLERRGLVVGGRDPRKTLSDVLRYELRLGRVERVGRGRFVARPRPRTTEQRHRRRFEDLQDEARRRRVGTM